MKKSFKLKTIIKKYAPGAAYTSQDSYTEAVCRSFIQTSLDGIFSERIKFPRLWNDEQDFVIQS